MLCPICKIDLKISDRNGIEIDYCPKCRGVWLDRGELDKLLERAGTAYDPTRDAPQFAPRDVRPSDVRPSDAPRYEDTRRYDDDRRRGDDRFDDDRFGDDRRRRDDDHPQKRKRGFLDDVFDIFD